MLSLHCSSIHPIHGHTHPPTRTCSPIHGDIRAVLRLLTTSDCVAPPSEEVNDALHTKPSPSIPDDILPEPPDSNQHHLAVMEQDVLGSIKATPLGSAAGLDGVQPFHPRQLVARYTTETGRRLLSILTELCNIAITGNIHEHARGILRRQSHRHQGKGRQRAAYCCQFYLTATNI